MIDNTEFFSDLDMPKMADEKIKEYLNHKDKLDEIRDKNNHEEHISELKTTIAGYRRELVNIMARREAEYEVYTKGSFEDAVKMTEVTLATLKEYTKPDDLRAEAEIATVDLINSLANGTDHYTDRIILLGTKITKKTDELKTALRENPLN